MRSVTTERFRKAYKSLTIATKRKAKVAYQRWKKDPYRPSVNFKQVHDVKQIYSVRIGNSYRALGLKEKNTIIWFWIGSHEDYNKMLKQI